MEILNRMFNLIKCTFGIHQYKYKRETIEVTSIFDVFNADFDVRECTKCGKKDILIRMNEWEPYE